MNEKDENSPESRNSVRIQDSFVIPYNKITLKEYNKKASLYVSRRTANRSTGKRNGAETFSFDWSEIENEVDFDPVMVKILFYLDQKIDKVISNQDKILKKFDTAHEDKEASAAGECIDISGSGVNMLITEKIDPGSVLELTIEPPVIPPLQIILLGKLSRIGKAKETDGFEASVTYTAINEDDREDLIKYIFQRQRELLYARKRSSDLSQTHGTHNNEQTQEQ